MAPFSIISLKCFRTQNFRKSHSIHFKSTIKSRKKYLLNFFFSLEMCLLPRGLFGCMSHMRASNILNHHVKEFSNSFSKISKSFYWIVFKTFSNNWFPWNWPHFRQKEKKNFLKEHLYWGSIYWFDIYLCLLYMIINVVLSIR